MKTQQTYKVTHIKCLGCGAEEKIGRGRWHEGEQKIYKFGACQACKDKAKRKKGNE